VKHQPSWEANRFAASQEIPHILWTQRFITAFTSARHLSVSRANSVQSITPHPTSWRTVLIISSHLRLGLPSGLFPSGLRDYFRKYHAMLSWTDWGQHIDHVWSPNNRRAVTNNKFPRKVFHLFFFCPFNSSEGVVSSDIKLDLWLIFSRRCV
jgi:hypothetical protein